ncbi:flagellar hook-basal body complex protein FliE [Azospirillum brasilense]|uniref:Flagellar hook-basal body complex protein FliE n=1 Tax=Azospirillum brasilense TaxID=192 RepID=A0A560BYM8_AZOBR|nr:flagellar hook-basal body complex protein FliE [Azospirillum brasilense]MBK3734087.1 flagellar basal body protein FliE [Azospirillum brasilense]TWA77714.1 flagellar hook-basal body complex protein FliE [Azospirillum brasilense]
MIEPIGRAAAAYGLHRAPLAQPAPAASLATPPTTAAAGSAPAETAASAESSFGAFLDRQVSQAVETLNEGERMSVAAVAGKAGTHEVVRSVLAAEMTVQTVVSIRDRMVQAYQDVMRMAI